MDGRQRKLLLAVGAAASASAAFALYQLSRLLFAMLDRSYEEVHRAMVAVAAAINSDSPDVEVPDELVLLDDQAGVYVLEGLQDLYFQRSVIGPTDWLWSFDTQEWFLTNEFQPDHALYLDPPSMVFLLRMHLASVARRKAAAAHADGSVSSGRGGSSGAKQAARIPPPLELPDWAAQQMQQMQQPTGSSWLPGSGGSSRGGAGRQLLDAPDLLCCPITGQLMLQPVVTPCGTTFEAAAVRQWITHHGSDPTTLEPLSLHDVYPNLVVRELVERWLAGEADVAALLGGSSAAATAGRANSGQQQDEEGALSEDPLSSFGATRSSSSGSAGDSSSLVAKGTQQQPHSRARLNGTAG